MRIVAPSVTLIDPPSAEESYKKIELAGRTCYKSEDKITKDSAEKFIRRLIERGHEAMLEHVSITAKFVCDRGVSHELVRHRLASYAQESTRYCNYSDEKFYSDLTFIEPCFFNNAESDKDSQNYRIWEEAMDNAEWCYINLINNGATPQEARSVLPNSLKTEIVVTMNIREWRHFFKLRAIGISGKPHPQMQQIAVLALNMFKEHWPVLFNDLEVS